MIKETDQYNKNAHCTKRNKLLNMWVCKPLWKCVQKPQQASDNTVEKMQRRSWDMSGLGGHETCQDSEEAEVPVRDLQYGNIKDLQLP